MKFIYNGKKYTKIMLLRKLKIKQLTPTEYFDTIKAESVSIGDILTKYNIKIEFDGHAQLKKLRGSMTQVEFAKKINIGYDTYVKLEQKNSTGTIEQWKQIQEALNISDKDMWNIVIDKGEESIC